MRPKKGKTKSLAIECPILSVDELPKKLPPKTLVHGDSLELLKRLPRVPLFDLVITSPPYNLQKAYERNRLTLDEYLSWQRRFITEVVVRLRPSASLCWQVGNYVENGFIEPLDVWLHPEFRTRGLKLRNRIIWRFGHGLHCKRRFSGRYEVILWYTKSDEYSFNLDAVRIPAKYPQKRYYKGPKTGRYSGNINGKNPEDVWDIPNVKGNHCEKTFHPCQFPVGLVERLVLALTKRNGLVFDPFCGVGSAGLAAVLHNRRFLGCDKLKKYLGVAQKRICLGEQGLMKYRPHDAPVYQASQSPLSKPRRRRAKVCHRADRSH